MITKKFARELLNNLRKRLNVEDFGIISQYVKTNEDKTIRELRIYVRKMIKNKNIEKYILTTIDNIY